MTIPDRQNDPRRKAGILAAVYVAVLAINIDLTIVNVRMDDNHDLVLTHTRTPPPSDWAAAGISRGRRANAAPGTRRCAATQSPTIPASSGIVEARQPAGRAQRGGPGSST